MQMNQETKNCQNCKKDFTIESEDFNFYEKIKVPPPTRCFECRQQRRYAWRNERTLYRRNCDLCKKSTVTIYSPNKPYKVYCNECWWGDGWDASSYGRDFDFTRPFFEQFAELQHEVPRMALLNKNSVNSDYTNHSGDNKNIYLSFSTWGSEDVMYSTWVFYSRDCMDSSFIYEKGERLYEIIDSRTSYQCQYGLFLKDCSSCYYCYDCRGCNNCFMSSNLRNKSYVFKNKQYTRVEYLKKLKEYDLSSHLVREGLNKEWKDMMQKDAIHRYVISERNVNSTGSLIFDCKNVKDSFEVNKGEDSKYLYSTIDPKNCMDLYHVGLNLELCYELQGCTRTSNCQFCHLCYDNMNAVYCDTCQNSQNLFGCVSVKKGEYMIFNKKYSKEEYLTLKEKIIEHMKKTGREEGEYGEFFPPSIAPVYYNETQGNLYMPMTKDEVLAKGWHWEDNVPRTFGKETIKSGAIPDKIEDVSDSYLSEIFICIDCSKNYNITQNELLFYRKEILPLPRKCPNCRYKRRFDLRPPRKLWHRQCMKEECPNEFETTYAPERPEKVYCESCYNKEVY
ncbi:hypothetical protein A2W67_03705 [Candidatus Nomurabacteria bacterium RIFCSPLOWO2_02_40_28]|uniref:Zinc-binding domain-containing protein n=2 Tax=Candidatus Nomuraibacteriota TaxID=1752729 RepID=A0A837HSS4_9BACT|nr:MAG: hypothetical protein UT27_C0004G0023 [Candidatus Nomurabacteria bacterium GW2011_GWD2_39_12]KKR20885.1 MAG: hypothetical protein UT51_C0001G0023 [Candidatus Nomurabacteria bacterium GW2011_GWC2_39_41]KKR36409.1 MAG: hypothetical protein UT70_C0014G0023 [Candidatus Nomurabacteria bacterium GW2011_GWE2_40_10]KKR38834.1 MAG: hypothetical protein UT73_C0001G0022 [Candidatus Nomurabacteria bacterium GW2011_GWB1_40_11]KKR40032.1 MAG: hypothetical protein UT74_C0003G0023 [Parcubacteria group b